MFAASAAAPEVASERWAVHAIRFNGTGNKVAAVDGAGLLVSSDSPKVSTAGPCVGGGAGVVCCCADGGGSAEAANICAQFPELTPSKSGSMVAYGGCVGRAADRREDGEGDLALGVASPARRLDLDRTSISGAA